MEAIQNILLNIQLFGIDLVKIDDFLELVIRFTMDLIVTVIIVRGLYYPHARRKDYLTTYIIIGTTIFLLCFLLENVKLQLGFALGLFAVFGIIRYRTNPIPIKEMTYLFLIIGISVINALANKKISYAELGFTNLVLIFVAFILEKVWLVKHEACKTIVYEKIDLIKPGNYDMLKKDLEVRTGLIINRVEVGNIDFLRDTAKVKIYYFEKDNIVTSANENEFENYSDDYQN
ncbi:MAG: DUF4956 domain-containing protein [Bacteroidales bacterium]|nr:DUF4956 domain-containing protein [Bacteroidales bacterium]